MGLLVPNNKKSLHGDVLPFQGLGEATGEGHSDQLQNKTKLKIYYKGNNNNIFLIIYYYKGATILIYFLIIYYYKGATILIYFLIIYYYKGATILIFIFIYYYLIIYYKGQLYRH